MNVIDPNFPHLGGNVAGGDPATFSPAVYEFLLTFTDKSKPILDIGCGEGHTAEWFTNHGRTAIALDGLLANCRTALTKGVLVVVHDITTGPWLANFPIGLAWCCEVVEHIEAQHVDNLMKTLCQADVVAMTHAIPGQCGYHHVNCQPASYWISKFANYGYVVDKRTAHMRAVAAASSVGGRSSVYCKNTGLIFCRGTS